MKVEGAKSGIKQIWEGLHWGARLMATPNDYRTHRMFMRGFSRADALRFLSGARGKTFIWPLNPEPAILEDKLVYEDHFGSHGLAVPHTRAVVGDIAEIAGRPRLATRDDKRDHIGRALLAGEQLVIKPLDAWEGEGVHVLTALDGDGYVLSNGRRMSASSLLDTISVGRWLVQDRIEQHEDMSVLNASTLNTLRLGTFRRRDGDVKIIFAILRIGRAHSQVDTYNQGGYSLRVDSADGKFANEAFQKANFSLNLATEHADSGVTFSGRRVPFWDEVVSTARAFAAAAGANRFVGWDVAFTPTGPVFVEGNHNWDIQLAQVGSKGLLTDEFTSLLRNDAGVTIETDRMPPLRTLSASRQFRRAARRAQLVHSVGETQETQRVRHFVDEELPFA